MSTNNIASTLIANQLKEFYDHNEKQIGEATINNESFNKSKHYARRSAFITFGSIITKLTGTSKPYYDKSVLKAPVKLDLNLESLQAELLKESYRLNIYHNELSFMDSKSYRINNMLTRHSALNMIIYKWLPSQVGLTASKPLVLPTLFAFSEPDINLMELKMAMKFMAQSNFFKSHVLHALNFIGTKLQEEYQNPSWDRVFSFESEDDLPVVKSERLDQLIFGQMVRTYIFLHEHDTQLDEEEKVFLSELLLCYENIATEMIPKIKRSVDIDVYNKVSYTQIDTNIEEMALT